MNTMLRAAVLAAGMAVVTVGGAVAAEENAERFADYAAFEAEVDRLAEAGALRWRAVGPEGAGSVWPSSDAAVEEDEIPLLEMTAVIAGIKQNPTIEQRIELMLCFRPVDPAARSAQGIRPSGIVCREHSADYTPGGWAAVEGLLEARRLQVERGEEPLFYEPAGGELLEQEDVQIVDAKAFTLAMEREADWLAPTKNDERSGIHLREDGAMEDTVAILPVWLIRATLGAVDEADAATGDGSLMLATCYRFKDPVERAKMWVQQGYGVLCYPAMFGSAWVAGADRLAKQRAEDRADGREPRLFLTPDVIELGD